mgnify:CR=1 FL=1
MAAQRESQIEPTHAAIISRIAVTETKIDDIRGDLLEIRARVATMETDVRAIREFLDIAKGGWRALAVVGVFITGIIAIVGWFAPTLIKKWLG